MPALKSERYQRSLTVPKKYFASQRTRHASLWAGSDVHYLHRRGQIIPDPVALYRHEPRSGQLLTDFPDVFPTLWSPN